MSLVGSAEEIAMRAIICRMAHHFIEAREEINRVTRHLNVHRRGKLRAHSTHALAG
jgi:hypothetical protein